MGIPSERLDYCIAGSKLSILGTILDGTRPGKSVCHDPESKLSPLYIRLPVEFQEILRVASCLGQSISYSDRALLNLTAAQHLEASLTVENEDEVLPAISFYYSQTGDDGKIVYCLEKLGCKYVQRCAFVKGIKTLSKLEDVYNSSDQNSVSTIDSLRRARWLSELAFALVSVLRLNEAANKALEL
ncbi:hypothetical protein HDU76_003917 [Blyttiomyces sp. JEL0837]|nr:hypothetical protein HDU76_003917 [Blyttiomyces sp. JEL0837]